MDRRSFLAHAGKGALGLAGAALLGPPRRGHAAEGEAPPNFVIIFADDLGYGDLGCTGHPTIRTPRLDRMATEGMKLTQFYVAAPVCTPSRAALLTGRLPVRSGMCSDRRRVLFPNSGGGLPHSEVTVAEALQARGYATACVGKWHLGHLPQFLPMRHGFDRYFGIPYSNDMRPTPLLDGQKIVEEPADQSTLTRRYTRRAVEFIEANAQRPFFLYFPHTFPHVPLFASEDFRGKSPRGLYGDVVEELDHSVGQVLDTLREHGLEKRTLVLFTSDNGPWLPRKLRGGSAGLLRGGKGSTWEGGMREPCIAWWPGTVPAGATSTGLASTLDILPTCLALAGVEPPGDRVLDGVDMTPILTGKGESRREAMFFYRGTRLYAVRKGPWKAHFITQAGYGDRPHPQDPPLLFHLERDPSERFDVAKQNPRVLDEIGELVAKHQAGLERPPSQLEIPLGKG
ncbi:MAG: sulfatase [Candidatus Brocadiia bacterium]